MYSFFRQCCERALRIPPEPAPPPGDETSTRIFRAAPNFYKYLLVIWAVATVFAFLFLSVVMIGPVAGVIELRRSRSWWAFLLLLIPVVVFGLFVLLRLFSLAVLRLDYEKRWYLVTDRSLRIREGVVTVREMTVTFANIQNISISQGPIQRLLGIADVQVDTAGGGGAAETKQGTRNLHTARFRGIDNAHEVRELIQQRLRQLKDSGLGDHEELALRPATAAVATSPDLLAALREVYAEACALRQGCDGRH
jgi:uncharacterized membrane protein YdbT with pleckstrin-like domain